MTQRTYIRTLIIVAGSLLVGFLVNQLHPAGIAWPLLRPAGVSFQGISYLAADSAFHLSNSQDIIFIDVRDPEEFVVDRLPGARSLPLSSFLRNPSRTRSWDKSPLYILYCFDPQCPEAEKVAQILAEQQFQQIAILFGGFSEWLEKGYPIDQEPAPQGGHL